MACLLMFDELQRKEILLIAKIRFPSAFDYSLNMEKLTRLR